MKKFFSKILRSLLVSLLGPLTLMLTACYAPAPIEDYYPAKFVKGKVTDKEKNIIQNSSVTATHKVDGEICTHENKTNEYGNYIVEFNCFNKYSHGSEPWETESYTVTISVKSENYKDAQEVLQFSSSTGRELLEKNFILEEETQ